MGTLEVVGAQGFIRVVRGVRGVRGFRLRELLRWSGRRCNGIEWQAFAKAH